MVIFIKPLTKMCLNLKIPDSSIHTRLFIFIKERSNVDKYGFLVDYILEYARIFSRILNESIN